MESNKFFRKFIIPNDKEIDTGNVILESGDIFYVEKVRSARSFKHSNDIKAYRKEMLPKLNDKLSVLDSKFKDEVNNMITNINKIKVDLNSNDINSLINGVKRGLKVPQAIAFDFVFGKKRLDFDFVNLDYNNPLKNKELMDVIMKVGFTTNHVRLHYALSKNLSKIEDIQLKINDVKKDIKDLPR